MSKAASVAFNDQQFDGIEKVCKRLLKLSFGRDTTRCRHSPNFDREWYAKHRHSSNMAEHDFVTHIVTHHTLAKPQRSNPLQPNPPSFQRQLSNIYLFPDWRFSFWPFFSVGDSIARLERLD